MLVRIIALIFLALLTGLGMLTDKGSVILALSSAADSPTPPEIILQTGHVKSVKAIVFGPANKWVATGAVDNTIRIWDTKVGQELRSLSGHSGAVSYLVVSGDGKILASAGNDKTVRIWDVAYGKEIRKFDVPGAPAAGIDVSSDGGFIALSGAENAVEMRSIQTGDLLWRGPADKTPLTALSFTPDGTALISGRSDGTISSWDAQTGKPSKAFKGHSKTIQSMKFDRAGTTLAASSGDGNVRQWNYATGRELSKSQAASEAPLDINYSPTDSLLALGPERAIVSKPGERNAKFASLAKCVDPNGVTEAAAFSRDGRLAGFGNGDGTISICEVATGRQMTALENHTVGFYDAAISADQRYVASAGFDTTVKLWDLQTGQNLPSLGGHTGRVTAVAFRPGTDQVISGSIDKSIRIWNTVTREPPMLLTSHADTVQSLVVSRSGNLLVSSSSDGVINVWDLRNPQAPPRSLKDHRGEVTSVDISSDEERVVSGGADGILRVWPLKSGSVVRSSETGVGFDSVAFSPDGKAIASGSSDGKIRIWNAADLTITSTLSGHTGPVYSVSFSGDGSRIVSASLDKSARMWSVVEGRELALLSGHEGVVYSAAFSPDQRFILTSSDDGALIFWPVGRTVPLARMITLNRSQDWLVVTGNGFFDGSPGAWERLSWRFDKATFSVSPIEIFFNEFFKPGLLAESLDLGSEPAGTAITAKDRRQPILKLTAVRAEGPNASRHAKITIDADDAGAGVRDVRLFRNGLLVKAWRGDILKDNADGKLDTLVPIVAGENVFSAYAFNSDNIKSRDSRVTVNGDRSLARRGVLYILAMGINEYSNADYQLKYAVADANDLSAEFKQRQADVNFYERVEAIELTDGRATKRAILDALGGLSARIQPEDGLLIFFAGHGIANEERFYLIPHDIGYSGRRNNLRSGGLEEIFSSSISDQELEKAFELIDAGKITFVIDACYSGLVLESEEKRQGPMNSKGLAQLAYEKGMYILTASQSYQAAKEASRLGHGFLTYALVEEGLRNNGADRDPKDGQILLREWLDFALTAVPQINEQAITLRKLEREKDKNLRPLGRSDLQRPRAFYRREVEARQFVVARSKPGTGSIK